MTDDLISRQQAIDALRDYLVGKRCPDDGTLTCRLIENEVINKLPSIQPERKTGRWIPVSERLPLPQTLVWTTDKHGIVSVCKLSYKSGGWYDKDEDWVYMHDSVIAWMPYDEPEPYQGESEDKK